MNYKQLFGRAFDDNLDKEFVYVTYPGVYIGELIGEEELVGIGYKISEKNLFSQSYCGCNGVALIGSKYGALSHYNLDLFNPKGQLEDMVNDFLQKDSNPLAFLIGGRKSHAELNRQVLNNLGIEVKSEYVDCFGSDNPDSFNVDLWPSKDVIVLTKEKKIIVRRRIGLPNYSEDFDADYVYDYLVLE